MGVESGGTKSAGDVPPRNDDILASLFLTQMIFLVFHHFQNKVAEIR